MELILGQQPSPSSGSAPETPSPDPPAVTIEPSDLTPNISTLISDPSVLNPEPSTVTPDPPTLHSEQADPQVPPTEPDPEDDAQVNIDELESFTSRHKAPNNH